MENRGRWTMADDRGRWSSGRWSNGRWWTMVKRTMMVMKDMYNLGLKNYTHIVDYTDFIIHGNIRSVVTRETYDQSNHCPPSSTRPPSSTIVLSKSNYVIVHHRPTLSSTIVRHRPPSSAFRAFPIEFRGRWTMVKMAVFRSLWWGGAK